MAIIESKEENEHIRGMLFSVFVFEMNERINPKRKSLYSVFKWGRRILRDINAGSQESETSRVCVWVFGVEVDSMTGSSNQW